MVDFVSGCSPCSYVFRGGAVRISYSLVAAGFVLFFSCCWGSALFGNKFLIIQKKKKVEFAQEWLLTELMKQSTHDR